VNLTGDAYQYLEKSVIPTYHFQQSLPRLPVPKLDATCERYLAGVKPIISEADYANTKKIVESFMNNEGKGLRVVSILFYFILSTARTADCIR
jgi:carnitine O-palmitoyltransferase 2